eukprot:TRINITY_DN9958_c0_g1_i2.p1 TRINITY_DN9958_c0_g1~~TRINITY_DN9958_c0_g1_i2.p1  ORF type:complete len:138 (+),score=22.63 TRINITY_DN9958_c0_g1_i2:429-842(+)
MGIRITFLNHLTQGGYVHILLYCDWDVDLTAHQVEKVADDINLVLSTRHGCFREPTDDAQRNRWLLIALSFFLILFLYCSLRAVFNILWRAATGWDVLPHVDLLQKSAFKLRLARNVLRKKERRSTYEMVDSGGDPD